MMRLLKAAGMEVGHHIHFYEELDAGMELSPAYAITTNLYTHFIERRLQIDLDQPMLDDFWKGYTYREAMNQVGTDPRHPERNRDVTVIKDPRITWHPELISAWHAGVESGIKVLLLHRRIMKIWKSRERFDHKDPKTSRRVDPNIYKQDFYETLVQMMDWNIQFELLMFPNFLYQPGRVLTKLDRLDVDMDYDAFLNEWHRIVDLKKVHFVTE